MRPLFAFALCLLPSLALADRVLPPPGGSGVDADLAAKAAGYQRQQDVFATLENGL